MKLSGTLAEKGLHAFDSEPRHHAGHEIPRIWIVVVDRIQAHVFRKTPNGMERIADAKRGTAVHENQGSAGFHGYDVRSEKHHHDDSVFLPKLATWLDVAEREKAYDRLVLVAAPRTLGDLRKMMSKNVHARIAAEVDKELTEMSENELRKHLDDIVWF
jgi:protein required for attachment to host cells